MRKAKAAHVRDDAAEPSRTSPGVERDDLLAGEFDQTNGVAVGLDGESDGTMDGENLPAAFRTGSMSPARLWHPVHATAVRVETEEAPSAAEAHHRRLRLRH